MLVRDYPPALVLFEVVRQELCIGFEPDEWEQAATVQGLNLVGTRAALLHRAQRPIAGHGHNFGTPPEDHVGSVHQFVAVRGARREFTAAVHHDYFTGH